MKFNDLIKQFRDDESGAVTVDWVVLTAAIVGLGIAVVATVGGGIGNMGQTIADALGGASVDTTGLDNMGSSSNPTPSE